jgi:hypothetical protein
MCAYTHLVCFGYGSDCHCCQGKTHSQTVLPHPPECSKFSTQTKINPEDTKRVWYSLRNNFFFFYSCEFPNVCNCFNLFLKFRPALEVLLPKYFCASPAGESFHYISIWHSPPKNRLEPLFESWDWLFFGGIHNGKLLENARQDAQARPRFPHLRRLACQDRVRLVPRSCHWISTKVRP